MEKVKPLKRFGQNYIRDNNIIIKIVSEINPKSGDNLIEIGPGLGALTNELVKYKNDFISVEVDNRVIEGLSIKYPELKLINDDFLKITLEDFYSSNKKKLRIVGNIPYNLTSSIIFKMIENNNIICDSVLMIQYKVAQRITAGKGTKEYGILSVLLNYFADVKLCFKISPNVFYPKPKVSSAVIHIFFKEISLSKEEKEIFIKIVKAAFGNRRKTIRNSFGNSIFKNINFENSGIDLNKRAEQLSIANFETLTKHALKIGEFNCIKF